MANALSSLVQTTEMQVDSQVNAANSGRPADDRTPPGKWQRFAVTRTLTAANRQLLLTLTIISVVIGYQGTVLTGLLTYAADSWDASLAARGRTLAALRGDIVITMVIVSFADRVGRRIALIGAAAMSASFTVLSALANGLWLFGALQFAARGANTAAAILIAVLIAEGLPAGTRAAGSSLVVATAALGSACVFVVSSQADRGPNWWRLMAVPSALFLLTLPKVAKQVRESERFREQQHHTDAPSQPPLRVRLQSLLATHWQRLVLISLFTLLFSFEVAPTRQLQSEYLRNQHGFGSTAVSLFSVLSNAPGVIGLLVGGRLADRIGRKKVIGIGLLGFAIGDAGLFLSSGSWLWVFSFFGAAVGGMSLAAMSVFPAELFPTNMRATADGITVGAGRIGGGLGVLFVGEFANKLRPGVWLACTTIAIWLALLVLQFVPETLNRELE
jgi:MFS family permease